MLRGLAGLIGYSISGCATSDSYAADNFDVTAALQDTVAVLPIDVTIVMPEGRKGHALWAPFADNCRADARAQPRRSAAYWAAFTTRRAWRRCSSAAATGPRLAGSP